MTGLPLAGRHALVTGAGGGIGAAVARTLAAAGARVTLAGRKPGGLEALAAMLPAGCAHVASGFDVTSPEAIAVGLTAARARLGPVDILVNNAGEALSAPLAKTTLAMWSQMLAVNLTGAFLVTQACLDDLKACKGGARLINIASTAGLTGYPYVCAYSAAKHGLIGLTRSLARELAADGMTVNAICPGFTDTPLAARAIEMIVAKTGRSAEEAYAGLVKGNPQARLVTPQEVADSVLWLALPGSASVHGQAIILAGGEVMSR